MLWLQLRKRLANRFDMSLPADQRKRDAADALARVADEAGISLVEMAIAFVLRHPGVTSAIIGPRTMEHLESQLAAADVEGEVAGAEERGVEPAHPASAARDAVVLYAEKSDSPWFINAQQGFHLNLR